MIGKEQKEGQILSVCHLGNFTRKLQHYTSQESNKGKVDACPLKLGALVKVLVVSHTQEQVIG